MAKPQKINDLDRYLDESNEWEKARKIQSEKSEKRAWMMTYIFAALATVSIIAVSALTPLKTVKTEIFVADKVTGEIKPLQSLKEVQVSLDEVFHKKFLYEFILARENYTPETAELNYYTAAAFMSPKLQEDWGNLWKPENPQNPMNVYKTQKVHIEVASIILKQKDDGTQDVATIRFSKTVTGPGAKDSGRFWVATVTYKMVDTPKNEKERLINPAGFQVVDYTVDPEMGGAQPIKPSAAPVQQ